MPFFRIFDIIYLMLMIRLQRVGRTNDPSFRVVVTEKTNGPQSGSFLEIVGSYDARKDRIDLKKDRIQHWLSHGAKTSGTVNNLLVKEKVIIGPKVDVRPRKKLTPPSSSAPEETAASKLASAEATADKEEKKNEILAETPKAEATKEEKVEENPLPQEATVDKKERA